MFILLHSPLWSSVAPTTVVVIYTQKFQNKNTETWLLLQAGLLLRATPEICLEELHVNIQPQIIKTKQTIQSFLITQK